MATIARYAAISVPGVNKPGIMTPDADGFYKLIVGAFNTCNFSGVFYPLLPSVRSLFEQGGIVRRRLDRDLCKGEYGHPDVRNMKLEDALARLARMEEKNICVFFKDFTLVDGKDEHGNDIVLVVALLTPMGPYGPTLKDQLDRKAENVAFSLRSLTMATMYQGKNARIVTDALTYDYVSEPGISMATQYNTAMSLEELHEFNFTERDLDLSIKRVEIGGLESDVSTLKMVRTSLGWQQTQVINLSALDWGR